jgi:hypothetical protein
VTESAPVPEVAIALRAHAGVAVVTDDRHYPVGIITSQALARRDGRDERQNAPAAPASQVVRR